MNVRNLDSHQLALLSAAPNEHQAAALEEQHRRHRQARMRFWASRYIDAASIQLLGVGELTECLELGRIDQQTHDAEFARRRRLADSAQKRTHGYVRPTDGTVTLTEEKF